MKRPKTAMPKTARRTNPAVARSRKEAAIQLVRIEFDMNRLEMGIDQAQERVSRYNEELSQRRLERQTLLDILKS